MIRIGTPNAESIRHAFVVGAFRDTLPAYRHLPARVYYFRGVDADNVSAAYRAESGDCWLRGAMYEVGTPAAQYRRRRAADDISRHAENAPGFSGPELLL